MAKLLEDACQDLSLWSLGTQKQGRYVITANLKYDKENALIQLAPFSDALSVYTNFQPSSFAGSQDQDRCSILFTIPDKLRECIEQVEEKIREDLRPSQPRIDALWHSSTKIPEKYPSALRAKI